MKKNLLISFVVLLIIAPLFAFKKSENKFSIDDLIPVKTGNEWRYRSIRFNRAGSVAKDTIVVKRYSGDTLIDGVKWTKSHWGNFVRNNSNGFTTWYKYHKNPELLFKFPVLKNEKYDIISPSYGKGMLHLVKRSVTVEETDTILSIGENSHHCIKYRVSEGESEDKEVNFFESVYYVSPGMGIVQVDTFADRDLYEYYGDKKGEKFLWSREQLIDFSLK